MSKGNIILGVTASIAIYKACEIARIFFRAKFGLRVVMTKHAAELISPRVFASLIGGEPVYSDEFVGPANWKIEHVCLADWADAALIAPATANIIGKAASEVYN